MFECIERKINIFISSEILGLEHFRKSLKFLLYETGIVKDIYVFEQTGASSNSCQNAYLNEIQKCDLFILIIKNSTGLSNQIKKEYDKALLYNKRILIFFYNDSDDTCDFKKQVQSDSTYFEKYAESNTLFDLEKLIYKSFVEDVIAIYTNNNFIEDNQTNDEFLKYRSFSVFHTDYLKELNDENGLFDFLKATKKEPNGNFIYDRLNDFFDVVLCSKKYDKESFSLLKSNINSKYPESLKEIFVSRIDAVELCFEGDQISSINKLKILYDKVKDDVSIPEWLKNDVLIDKRNLEYSNNDFNQDTQKLIENLKESIYYPVLDRLSSNIEKNICGNISKSLKKSPYTVTFGEDKFTFNLIKKYFYIAFFYGSITHLNLVRRFLADYLESLSMLTEDISVYLLMIKYKFLSKDFDSLKLQLRNIELNDCRLKFINYKDIYNSICNCENENDKDEILINFIGMFCDSFSDELFDEAVYDVKNIIEKKRISLNVVTGVCIILANCCNRLSIEELLSILTLFVKQKHISLSRLKQLFANIDYSRFENQNDIKKLESLIKDNIDIMDNQSLDCAFYVCVNLNDKVSDLIDLIKESNQSYYKNHLLLYLPLVDSMIYISRIKCEIMNVQKNITRIGKDIDITGKSSFRLIDAIIEAKSIKLDKNLNELLIETCIKAISSGSVKTSDKIDAISLLIKNKNNLFYNIDQILAVLDDNTELQSSPFESGDNEAYRDIVNISKYVLARKKIQLSRINNLSSIAKIKVVSFCLSIIEIIKQTEDLLIVFSNTFAFFAYDDETDVRYFSLKCLLKLYRADNSLIDIALIENVITTNNRYLKHLIINEYDIFDTLLPEEYKQFLLCDNSWSVRNHSSKKIQIDYKKIFPSLPL